MGIHNTIMCDICLYHSKNGIGLTLRHRYMQKNSFHFLGGLRHPVKKRRNCLWGPCRTQGWFSANFTGRVEYYWVPLPSVSSHPVNESSIHLGHAVTCIGYKEVAAVCTFDAQLSSTRTECPQRHSIPTHAYICMCACVHVCMCASARKREH